MQEPARLHTATRRYCMERDCHLRRLYSALQSIGGDRSGSEYTKEALELFPRYNVLTAILTEVERFVPNEFSSLAEAKELLITAGRIADDIMTKSPHHPIVEHVMAEERRIL